MPALAGRIGSGPVLILFWMRTTVDWLIRSCRAIFLVGQRNSDSRRTESSSETCWLGMSKGCFPGYGLFPGPGAGDALTVTVAAGAGDAVMVTVTAGAIRVTVVPGAVTVTAGAMRIIVVPGAVMTGPGTVRVTVTPGAVMTWPGTVRDGVPAAVVPRVQADRTRAMTAITPAAGQASGSRWPGIRGRGSVVSLSDAVFTVSPTL